MIQISMKGPKQAQRIVDKVRRVVILKNKFTGNRKMQIKLQWDNIFTYLLVESKNKSWTSTVANGMEINTLTLIEVKSGRAFLGGNLTSILCAYPCT